MSNKYSIPSDDLRKFSTSSFAQKNTNEVPEDYIQIDIARMQYAIDSGFNVMPKGLTPEQMVEYIMNN